MTSRKRRRSEKRRRLRHANQALAASLPRPIRLIVEGFQRFEEYAGVADSPVTAAERARERVGDAARTIARVTADYDAFDVLELIRLHNAFANPETFSENEHEGSTSVIELAALVMTARGTRVGASVPEGRATRQLEHVVEAVETSAREAIDAGLMLIMFGSALAVDPFQRLAFGAQLREVSLRNVSYAHMVEDTLTALFDQPAVDVASRRVLGCTVREVRQVFAALRSLHSEAWSRRFAALFDIAQLDVSRPNEQGELRPEVLTQGRALLAQVWDNPSACSIFADDVIARRANVDAGIARTVLDLFATEVTGPYPRNLDTGFMRLV